MSTSVMFPELTAADRYIAGACIIILSIIGLSANIFIFFSKNIPRKRNLLSLNIASTVFLLPNFFVYLPCSTTHCPFYSDLTLVLLSSADTLGYYVYQLSLLQVSLDRLLIFYSPRFSEIYEKLWIPVNVSIWLFIGCLMLAGSFLGCQKTYNVQWLFFFFQVTSSSGQLFLDFFINICYITSGAMLLSYVAVLIKIRLLQKRMGSSGRIVQEIKLMLQYLYICLFSILGTVCFFFLEDFKKFFNSPLTVLPVSMSTIALTSHSYIFLLSNIKLRSIFKRGGLITEHQRSVLPRKSISTVQIDAKSPFQTA